MSYMRPETCSWKMKLYKLICKCFCCSWFKTKSRSPEFDDIESCIPKETKEKNTGRVERKKKLISISRCCQTIVQPLLHTRTIGTQTITTKSINPQKIKAKSISTQTVIPPQLIQTNQAPQKSNLLVLKRQMGESMETFLNRLKCKHKVNIIQAKRGNGTDGHGNKFYCCSCRLPHKNHTSFQTNEAMEKHCEIKHGLVVGF